MSKYNDYYNNDQIEYMDYLSKLPKEKKCDCGWYRRGECYTSCYGKPEKGGAPLPTKEEKNNG